MSVDLQKQINVAYKAETTKIQRITKRQAMALMDELKQQLIWEPETNPNLVGRYLAQLESYFMPVTPRTPKTPLDYVAKHLSKDKQERRPYALYGYYIEGLGLCCTDSKSLAVLKTYTDNSQPWYNPTTKLFMSNDGNKPMIIDSDAVKVAVMGVVK